MTDSELEALPLHLTAGTDSPRLVSQSSLTPTTEEQPVGLPSFKLGAGREQLPVEIDGATDGTPENPFTPSLSPLEFASPAVDEKERPSREAKEEQLK
jgi:hypothetical protein